MWYVRPAKPQIRLQSDQSLCLSLEYPMSVKRLTEHHLRFQSLKGGCTGWSESTLVKMPHFWKSFNQVSQLIRVEHEKSFIASGPDFKFPWHNLS